MTAFTSIVGKIVLILWVAMSLGACATGRTSFNALVVYQEYDGKDPNWPSINTEIDAASVKKALEGMKRTDVQMLHTVSKAGWERAFETYLKKFPEERREDAVIFIAAHGFRGDDGWTYLVDGRGAFVALEPLLEKVMSRARASLIFVDVCRSPEQQSEQVAKQLAQLRVKQQAPKAAGLAGLKGNQAVILFSTDAGNAAVDAKPGEGTRFTQAFTREFVKRQELRVTLRNIVWDLIDGEAKHADVKRGQKLANPKSRDFEQNPWPYGLITFDVFPAGRPSSGGAT